MAEVNGLKTLQLVKLMCVILEPPDPPRDFGVAVAHAGHEPAGRANGGWGACVQWRVGAMPMEGGGRACNGRVSEPLKIHFPV